MAMINCPECKKEVSSQATACPHCGYPLIPTKTDKPPVTQPPLAAPQGRSKAEKKGKGCAGCLTIIVVIIVILYGIGKLSEGGGGAGSSGSGGSGGASTPHLTRAESEAVGVYLCQSPACTLRLSDDKTAGMMMNGDACEGTWRITFDSGGHDVIEFAPSVGAPSRFAVYTDGSLQETKYGYRFEKLPSR